MDYKYTLMTRDNFSSYCWLPSLEEANSENSADALLEWASIFTIFNGMMFDGPKHFKNETFRPYTKGLRAQHNFNLPSKPCSDKGIVRMGKELLETFSAVQAEFSMQPEKWTTLIPTIQSVLNNSPSPQRNNLA